MNKEEEIEELKSALNDAIRSFTRMGTLYKLKCNELDVEKEKTKKETAKEILQVLFDNHFEKVNDYENRRVGYSVHDFYCEIKRLANEYGIEVDE